MFLKIHMMRKGMRLSDMKRDAGLTTPESVIRFNNIQYGSHKYYNLLDVYKRKDAQGLQPVIIHIHGGGWIYGTKEIYQFYTMSLAERGFAVINFNYRLAPKYKFPSQLEDVNLVITWMFEHAEEFNFDTSHVFLIGDSAGAHLNGLYTSMCTNLEYANLFKFKVPNDFIPKAVVLNCGVYDVYDELEMRRKQMTFMMKAFLGKKDYQSKLSKINVLDHMNDKFPPTYVMSSSHDFLLRQAPIMVKKLEELKIPHIYHVYGDKDNPLYHVFHVNIKDVNAKLCNDETSNFLKKY